MPKSLYKIKKKPGKFVTETKPHRRAQCAGS